MNLRASLRIFLVVLGFLSFFYPSESKYVIGHLITKEHWHFLARFCFLSGEDQNRIGSVDYNFTFPASHEGMELYFYFDDQWKDVYKTDKKCSEKISVLRRDYFQIVQLSENYQWSGCKRYNSSGYVYLHCQGTRNFRSFRPRWWFITVGRCKPENNNGIDLSYNLHLTNGAKGDYFFRELSADQFTILEVDIAFLIFFSFMTCVAVVFSAMLRSRQLYHSTYKMFIVSLVAYNGYLFFICIHYGRYVQTGLEERECKVVAYVCQAFSVLTFQLLLILLGKGYTITRGQISRTGSIKIAVFMTVCVFVYAGIFLWETEFFDPGMVLYRYESPPGYGLIVMRIIGWLWFCFAIVTTVKHHIEKLQFYIFFFFTFTLWFWASGITFVVAINAVPWHLREKIVNGVEIAIDFSAHLIFLTLTSPLLFNKMFPFHIRTTQIVPSDSDSSSSGMDTEIQTFQLSTVSSSYLMGQGPNIASMFITSNTLTTKLPNQDLPDNNLTRPVMPLPSAPSPPPSYDALFQARTHEPVKK